MANAPRLTGLSPADLRFDAAADPGMTLDGTAGARGARRWPLPLRLAIIIGSAALLWAMIFQAIAALF